MTSAAVFDAPPSTPRKYFMGSDYAVTSPADGERTAGRDAHPAQAARGARRPQTPRPPEPRGFAAERVVAGAAHHQRVRGRLRSPHRRLSGGLDLRLGAHRAVERILRGGSQ